MDRVLYLDFEATDELGDQKAITVAVEIMGRHSNIIVVSGGKVLDSIKRVDHEMSSVRPVLPGLPYVVPPQQGKLRLLDVSDPVSYTHLFVEHVMGDYAYVNREDDVGNEGLRKAKLSY